VHAYLKRHWRGQLPLAAAWWVNGVALTALCLWLDLNAARFGIGELLTTRNGFTVYVAAGLAFFLLLPGWQVMGIFRAADRHADEVGTLLSARLVQSLATLLTLLLATRFLVFASEAAAGARLAYPLGGSGYTVTVTHGGRLLEVRGGLIFGVAEEVSRALDSHPQVRRIRLNSGGGALSEGRALRWLILARGLDTDSTTGCSSACVSAYIGGRHRLLRSSAPLGFHLPRNPGFGLRGPVAPQYAEELGYFAGQGVPQWFRQRWTETGRTFWYPTPRQLQAAGIVHVFYGRPRPGEEGYFLRQR